MEVSLETLYLLYTQLEEGISSACILWSSSSSHLVINLSVSSPPSLISISSYSGITPKFKGFQPLSASSKAVIPTTASFSAVSLLLSCVVLQSCLIIFPLFYLCIQPLSIACEELLST
ncbi:hypothetical protein SETIT_5G178600v2 [Setaria italica]|uniref:Uncharacterized protein n=1 Tax=Setaria italica TaxID=4555 RepID=A0A368R5X3_SETIT|nr:hypothetical protein SETIT_5G178600v2 [Setaria italica]